MHEENRPHLNHPTCPEAVRLYDVNAASTIQHDDRYRDLRSAPEGEIPTRGRMPGGYLLLGVDGQLTQEREDRWVFGMG
jgi:hypothetical protein